MDDGVDDRTATQISPTMTKEAELRNATDDVNGSREVELRHGQDDGADDRGRGGRG